MKLLKTSNWIRLRGQFEADTICKIDSPVSDKERVFFVPETDDEKTFFSIDMSLGITGVPQGPTSHDPDEEWGWRFLSDATEEDMKKFTTNVEHTLEAMYNQGAGHLQDRRKILN